MSTSNSDNNANNGSESQSSTPDSIIEDGGPSFDLVGQLVKDIQRLSNALTELKNDFVIDQRRLEPGFKVAAHLHLGDLLQVLKLIYHKYSDLDFGKCLAAASELIDQVKDFNYEDGSVAAYSGMAKKINDLAKVFCERLNKVMEKTNDNSQAPLIPSSGPSSEKLIKAVEDLLQKLAIDLPEARSTLEYDVESFKTSANEADVLGTGSYGTVRRCYHDLLKKYVVVKCMHCGGSTHAASTSIDVAKREIRFLTRLDHPHIVQTYGITSWDQCFGIIMEEVKGGDLYTLMVVKNIEVDWKARYRIMFELADALKYLHSHNPELVHLDVKPENVLLTLNLSVKLADFGSVEIARVTGATSTTTPSAASSKNQFTPLYTAPERLRNIFGTKAKSSMDVYSFAMVCYEVITRQAVFLDARANLSILTDAIVNREVKPNRKLIDDAEDKVKKENSADLEIFQHLKNVMEKCWCFEAEDRPLMKEVVQEMNEFGVCKESYESNTKSEADEITEPDQTAEQVSLNHFFPPFQRVSNFDASDKSDKHTDQ